MDTKELPFAKEFITDTKGHITKIIMDFNDYQRFHDWIENEGLARAMNEVKNEVPLNLEDALKEERSLVKICVNLRNLWTSLK